MYPFGPSHFSLVTCHELSIILTCFLRFPGFIFPFHVTSTGWCLCFDLLSLKVDGNVPYPPSVWESLSAPSRKSQEYLSSMRGPASSFAAQEIYSKPVTTIARQPPVPRCFIRIIVTPCWDDIFHFHVWAVTTTMRVFLVFCKLWRQLRCDMRRMKMNGSVFFCSVIWGIVCVIEFLANFSCDDAWEVTTMMTESLC